MSVRGRIYRRLGLSANLLQVCFCMKESSSMVLMHRAWAVMAAAIFIVGFASVSCDAAGYKSKAKATVRPAKVRVARGSKVSVPSNILQGSLVTKGRAFYRTSIQENMLADVRLGRPANLILARWGNPTRITVGTATATADAGTAQAPVVAGPQYVPPGGGYMGMGAPGMMGMTGPALPSLPGLAAPGMYGQPTPGTGTPQNLGGSASTSLSQEEVTWTYDLPDGITLEFIITDGIITQITVGGEGPWALSKTRTGIQLGDTYKLVLWVNGFPKEPQKYVGRFLRVSYIDKNRTLFTFLNKKLVGITIALVQDELREGAGIAGG